MKRSCTMWRCSSDRKRAIFIDDLNAPILYEYMARDRRHQRKFEYICRIILEGLRNTELYDKEDINEKCRSVTAMKFFKGQENDRIYCQELTTEAGTRVVITCELYERKKSARLTNKEKQVIEKVAGYEYQIEK